MSVHYIMCELQDVCIMMVLSFNSFVLILFFTYDNKGKFHSYFITTDTIWIAFTTTTVSSVTWKNSLTMESVAVVALSINSVASVALIESAFPSAMRVSFTRHMVISYLTSSSTLHYKCNGL